MLEVLQGVTASLCPHNGIQIYGGHGLISCVLQRRHEVHSEGVPEGTAELQSVPGQQPCGRGRAQAQ